MDLVLVHCFRVEYFLTVFFYFHLLLYLISNIVSSLYRVTIKLVIPKQIRKTYMHLFSVIHYCFDKITICRCLNSNNIKMLIIIRMANRKF